MRPEIETDLKTIAALVAVVRSAIETGDVVEATSVLDMIDALSGDVRALLAWRHYQQLVN